MEIAQIEYPATSKPQRCKHIATQGHTGTHRRTQKRHLHPLIYIGIKRATGRNRQL